LRGFSRNSTITASKWKISKKRLPSILDNALQNKSIADAHVFTLCELSGSFEPALRLFKKRYGDLFANISG
jgi:hypothetical protein